MHVPNWDMQAQKKNSFHNRLCCPDCSQSASHRRIPACVYDDSTARLPLSLCFYGQGAAQHTTCQDCPGDGDVSRNYVRVHSGRCFSESLEQIFVDELMSVSYVTVIAELL